MFVRQSKYDELNIKYEKLKKRHLDNLNRNVAYGLEIAALQKVIKQLREESRDQLQINERTKKLIRLASNNTNKEESAQAAIRVCRELAKLIK